MGLRYVIRLMGSEPTAQSALWQEPVKCDASVLKVKTFYQGKESLPITWQVKLIVVIFRRELRGCNGLNP